jgi:hypothetical protein
MNRVECRKQSCLYVQQRGKPAEDELSSWGQVCDGSFSVFFCVFWIIVVIVFFSRFTILLSIVF